MKKALIIFCINIMVCMFANAQLSNFKWSFILDGQADVDITGLVVDGNGNTYVSANYSSNLTIAVLNKQLPNAPHVHGLILKLDKNGKPLWAHAFKSDFDNRINGLAVAPNGDILITGFGDGLLCFPGQNDTLKAGIEPNRKSGSFTRFQGFYVARYAEDGDRKWVQYWNCSWGEAESVAVNKNNEVFVSYYHQGDITDNEKTIDTFTRKYGDAESKISIAKYSGDGVLQNILPVAYAASSSALYCPKIKFDHDDNMYLYGCFNKRIQLTTIDSLVNDSYYEGIDSYIAKYTPDGSLLWVKKIGGQNTQIVEDIDFASDNSVYATGYYSYECIVGDGINVVQKSKAGYQSGNSFFYLHLFNDGEADFVYFKKSEKYTSYFQGKAIAVAPNGLVHLLGEFTDTLKLNQYTLTTGKDTYSGYYSYWKNDELQKIQAIGSLPEYGALFARFFKMSNNSVACGGSYYGKGASIIVDGKKQVLSNDFYGRNSYIMGGSLKATINPFYVQTSKDTAKLVRVKQLEPLLACVKSIEDPQGNLWFNTTATIKQPVCGEEVKNLTASLYPNPTNGIVNIKITGAKGRIKLDIFSADGKLVMAQQIENIEKEEIITLNVSNAIAGTYIVRISQQQYIKALKFVKQ